MRRTTILLGTALVVALATTVFLDDSPASTDTVTCTPTAAKPTSMIAPAMHYGGKLWLGYDRLYVRLDGDGFGDGGVSLIMPDERYAPPIRVASSERRLDQLRSVGTLSSATKPAPATPPIILRTYSQG